MTSAPGVALAADRDGCYQLTLFVSGASDLSARAIDDVRRMCDAYLSARAVLTVVDVHAEPQAALSSRIRVVPTLVRTSPPPVRRVVGDLSQSERVLSALLVAGHVDDGPQA